jgi:signal transduction histidine kinase/ActR/RegA family two-component response regulator
LRTDPPDGGRAPCGLVTFTDDGRIRFANDWLHGCVGAAPGGLFGTALDKLFTPAARVFHSTHFFPLLKLHGEAEEMYLALRGADGAEVPVLASATREVVDGEALNHCALMRMSRRKEFEAALVDARQQAEAATAARDQFLAVVSHELRTPLSAILGWVGIARKRLLDETMLQRAFDTIERSARAQSVLIEDLLDVSRIMSGKLRLSPRPITLGTVVESAVDTARPSAAGKDIEIVLALDHEAGVVYADPDRMQQVVWNLVSNAIKFTPRGGRVQVVLQRAGSAVRLQVSDTGCGIAPSQLPYLFERFWQADPTTQRERTGLGLGLSICRSLVEMHGGSVRAESGGPGQGSTFTVELPLAVVAPPARQGHAALFAGGDLKLDGVRVLLVDDDDDAREMMSVLLGGYGASVRSAASCEAALAALTEGEFDLLVSDVGMPGQDGYDLIRQVRGGGAGRHQDIPAVAVTGLARPQDRVSLLRAGYQAHLPKPVDPEEAVALVAALAGRR